MDTTGSHTGKVPAYRHVYSDLRTKIKTNKYPVGSFLPTESELEKIYGVSRTTIRRAIALLVEDGRIRVTQGLGTEVIARPPMEKFVNVKSISNVTHTNSKPEKFSFSQDRISIDEVKVNETEAAALHIPVGTSVFRLQRLLTIDATKQPVIFIVNLIPKHLTPDFPSQISKFRDLYGFLEETYNVKYLSSEEYITAKSATFMESAALNVPVGSPLLYSYRISQCNLGPMEYAYCTYVPDLHMIKVTMDVHDYSFA